MIDILQSICLVLLAAWNVAALRRERRVQAQIARLRETATENLEATYEAIKSLTKYTIGLDDRED